MGHVDVLLPRQRRRRRRDRGEHESDSHDNHDLHSDDGPGENADGFGSHCTPADRAANVFRGCRAWWNADGGFDLISACPPAIIENSWAWCNGYVPGTTTPSGDGVGPKSGSYGATTKPTRPSGRRHHPAGSDRDNRTARRRLSRCRLTDIPSSAGLVDRQSVRNRPCRPCVTR
ncbi:right-handed parallel beta-helix repeat-containing protein [Streptomyces beigongshangae]|uniref:right-handed parallel beta-helix repeat-containing protein n=1 Tax=Streptomyces beigongshangae TaxID=2841597 RepID=UPI003D30FB51